MHSIDARGARTAVLLALAMAVAGCVDGSGSASTNAPAPARAPIAATDAGDPALTLVKRLNMGSNLETMANQVAKSTHAYGLIVQKHGADRARSIVAMEIEKTLPRYQDRWNQNLAAAYSAQLSQDELRALVTEGKDSRYANKFMSVRGAVAMDMKSKSAPLLNELVTTALSESIGSD